MLNFPLKPVWLIILLVLSQSIETTTGTGESGGFHSPSDDSGAVGKIPNLPGGQQHLPAPPQRQQHHRQQRAKSPQDPDDSGQSSSSPARSRLTRLTFSDLQRASANSYSSSCCHLVPELCTPAGRCALNVTDCVSFCICARSPELRWCPGELQRLRHVLELRLEEGLLRRGEGGGGDEHIPGLSPGGPRSLSLGGLGLEDALRGASLGSLNLPGQSEDLSSPPEDGARLSLSPAQLASSLGSLGSLGGGVGDVAGDASDDALSGDTSAGAGGEGRPGKNPPPLSPMMVNGGGGGGGGAGGEGVKKNSEESTWKGNGRGNDDDDGDGRGAGGFFAALHTDNNIRTDTETLQPINPTDINSTTNSSAIRDNSNNDNNSSSSSSNDLTPQIIIPWWPNGGDGGDSSSNPCSGSGAACAQSGGRCVFDFNTTYSQVCVYDSVDPCQTMNCVHGTCVTRNGSHSCACHEGWAGTLCSRKCELDCGPHGACVVMKGQPACRCQNNYTGVLCDDLKPTPTPWTVGDVPEDTSMAWKIAAGCLGLTALLLLLLLLLGYVTWRRQWLPIRRLVYNFQHYEDDDGKEYDAFVSYRSASRDEQFVLHELYPQLERHLDFKLCMHFRDFSPGETIANNIIQAIESSRRTILILSPAYVQSEWCRLEYQKAQHEMLKLRHKIIPVLIEDVSHVQSIDRNLQTILDTVTYIRWPGNQDSKSTEKFWKLLRLSMPKKKGDYSRSLSSTGSCSSDRPLTAVSSACFNNVVCDLSSDVRGLHPQRSLSITSSFDVEEEEEDDDDEQREREKVMERETPLRVKTAADCVKSKHVARFCGDPCCDSDYDNGSGDSGCPRDRASSSESEEGGGGRGGVAAGVIPPHFPSASAPLPPLLPPNSSSSSSSDPESHSHVTSDDHIVEIRELPAGGKVKVTPWVPARFYPNV